MKAQKLKPGEGVDELKSRPIVSCSGSLLEALGIWVDRKLQPLAQKQPAYFKNSWALKNDLLELGTLPANARLFTADAVSMYTNIPTDAAYIIIRTYLERYWKDEDRTFPWDAVSKGLNIIMRNNVFNFGDLCFKQLNGTEMRTAPGPSYATIYYGRHEAKMLPNHDSNLLFYRRFIDDVIGIILVDDNDEQFQADWRRLKTDMNKCRGLEWTFTEPSKKVDFMDMTVEIKDGRIVTTLYEKPMNLHLYIPPKSAHPPGLLPGMVFGTIFRIYTLCSTDDDKLNRTRTFYKRLKARGWQTLDLLPHFKKAITVAKTYDPNKPRTDNSKDIFLHLPFHPDDPESYKIQKIWHDTVVKPSPWTKSLEELQNPVDRSKPEIKRMIIAYRRTLNLGNLLSARKLDQLGPPVSSYLD